MGRAEPLRSRPCLPLRFRRGPTMPQFQTWEEFSRAAEKLYLADPMKVRGRRAGASGPRPGSGVPPAARPAPGGCSALGGEGPGAERDGPVQVPLFPLPLMSGPGRP